MSEDTAPVDPVAQLGAVSRLIVDREVIGGALLTVCGSVGPGGGMALVFFGTGVLGVLVGLCGFLVRTVRDADTALPDHDTLPELVTSA